MEKMQLGSPAGGSPVPNSYLPNFLMGIENTPTNRSFSNSPTASPEFSRSNLQQRFLTGLQSPSAGFPNSSHNQSAIQQQQAVYQSQSNNNNSISGPPINSLFDNLRNDKSFQTPTKSFVHPQVVHQDTPLNTSGFNQSRIFSPIPYNDFNNSYHIGSTSQVVPPNQSFNINASINAGNVNKFSQNDFWVTVFGFQSDALSAILSHFSTCGTILEKVCSSGNWVHLRFSSKGEFDKALLYNGKIIGNIMIGVIKCQDESVTDKENSIDCSRASVNRIRSLTQAAYKSSKNEHEVTPSLDDPKKSSGIVNKAMDLLFGW